MAARAIIELTPEERAAFASRGAGSLSEDARCVTSLGLAKSIVAAEQERFKAETAKRQYATRTFTRRGPLPRPHDKALSPGLELPFTRGGESLSPLLKALSHVLHRWSVPAARAASLSSDGMLQTRLIGAAPAD